LLEFGEQAGVVGSPESRGRGAVTRVGADHLGVTGGEPAAAVEDVVDPGGKRGGRVEQGRVLAAGVPGSPVWACIQESWSPAPVNAV
jgi:hypothetical protein